MANPAVGPEQVLDPKGGKLKAGHCHFGDGLFRVASNGLADSIDLVVVELRKGGPAIKALYFVKHGCNSVAKTHLLPVPGNDIGLRVLVAHRGR